MKTELIALAAGALLSATTLTVAQASPAGDQWLANARATLEARLAADAVPDAGRRLVIKLNATTEPRAYNLRILHTSGSAEYDDAARRAFSGIRLGRPPEELRGRSVTFTLGETTGDAAAR